MVGGVRAATGAASGGQRSGLQLWSQPCAARAATNGVVLHENPAQRLLRYSPKPCLP